MERGFKKMKQEEEAKTRASVPSLLPFVGAAIRHPNDVQKSLVEPSA